MKRKVFSLCFIALAASLCIVGCSNDDDNHDGNTVNVRNVYDSGCKTSGVTQESALANGSFADMGFEESVEYTSKDDGYVFIKHVNSILQCCSDKKNVDISRNGNKITVREYDVETSCNCLCPFDMQYEIGPLEPGEYVVTFSNTSASFTFTHPSKGKVVID